MKIEDIQEEWKEDAKVDINRLKEAQARTFSLLAKWQSIYFNEQALLNKYEKEYRAVKKTANRMVSPNKGATTKEEEALGLEPIGWKVTKTDEVELFSEALIDSKKEWEVVADRYKLQKLKVKYLETVVETIRFSRVKQIESLISAEISGLVDV